MLPVAILDSPGDWRGSFPPGFDATEQSGVTGLFGEKPGGCAETGDCTRADDVVLRGFVGVSALLFAGVMRDDDSAIEFPGNPEQPIQQAGGFLAGIFIIGAEGIITEVLRSNPDEPRRAADYLRALAVLAAGERN